ncbi:MAG: hypothetical protein ORN98_08510, partial [Alphaproteobacteria bacterium]|nr:hypothetical protein [Alphaproteobacteria bacterium]
IYLTASGARQLVDAVVENSGSLNVTSLTAKGGVVKLRAEGGNITHSGTIEASGAAGGGNIIIGGDFHGAAQQSPISGRVLLNSDQVYVTKNATISADALNSGDGGKIAIWSDIHTQFLGSVTAKGGSVAGNGGFVEVSGKKTLDFRGLVTTVAPRGKMGTLLLDPSDITIQTTGPTSATLASNTYSSNNNTSILTVANLVTALGSSNVTVDATAGTGTGSGVITVANAINSTSNNDLTLTGAQIILKANVNLGSVGILGLSANRGSVWQDPTTVITALAVGGNAHDGFILNGNNQISALFSITNTGSGGISIKNAESMSVSVLGATLDGGTGGVSILTPGYNFDLNAGLTVKGSFLRGDLGSGKMTGNALAPAGGYTLNAKNMDVYFTGKTTGNNATIDVGNGSFSFVNDKRSVTALTTLTSSTTNADIGSGLG